MRFGAPEWLVRIGLLLPLAAVLLVLLRRRIGALGRLVKLDHAGTLLPGYRAWHPRARIALRITAIFFVLLALSRPQWGTTLREVPYRGLDLMVVMDTSRSMLADDLRPSRLQQAQWAVRDFVLRLDGDRTGLVAFAGGSYLVCPLTTDRGTFLMALDDLYAGIIPRGGTAIEQALRTAIDSFEEAPDTDRVILLITDGEDHEGDPLRLVDTLREKGIRVFCIGAATPDGALIPTEEGFLRDAQGRVVRSRLNEELLRELAARTGGLAVRAVPGDFGLDHILEHGLSGLRRGERDTVLVEQHTERLHWFALAALFFLFIEGLIRPAVLLGLLLLVTPLIATAEPATENGPELFRQGISRFESSRFLEAADAFSGAAAATQRDRLRQRALYNQSISLLNAAWSEEDPEREETSALHHVEDAIVLLEQALKLDRSDQDARENLQRALNRAGEIRLRSADRRIEAAHEHLTVFEASAARQLLEDAMEWVRPILDDLAPECGKATQRMRQIRERLDLLEQALRTTRYELEYAKQAIDLFQYRVAAEILLDDKPARRFAFDLDSELNESFQSVIENNQQILEIIDMEREHP